jgi:hypothetical protein
VKRIALALLTPVAWSPPGVDPGAWRTALAEDSVDLLAGLAELTAGIAVAEADRALAAAVAWPGMPVYALPAATPRAALEAAAADGYQQAAVLLADAPDLPGLLVGKLLRPLGTRPLALAPAHDGGLLGVAARLPLPDWVPELDVEAATVDELRTLAPRRGVVAEAPGWHRLRGPGDLRRLDPGLEGWDATRALLGG